MVWKPGQSGNPGGQHKGTAELREAARKWSPKAIAKLCALIDSDDERVALAAAEAVLNRGYGKPPQALEHGGTDGGPITFTWLPIMEAK